MNCFSVIIKPPAGIDDIGLVPHRIMYGADAAEQVPGAIPIMGFQGHDLNKILRRPAAFIYYVAAYECAVQTAVIILDICITVNKIPSVFAIPVTILLSARAIAFFLPVGPQEPRVNVTGS